MRGEDLAGAISETERGRKLRVAVDRRLAGGEGTGVASYARALEAALRRQGIEPLPIEDRSVGRFGGERSRAEQTRRWLEAWRPGARRLTERGDPPRLWRRDLFRLVHVRFRLTGRVLRLRAPGPPGVAHWTYPVPAVIDGWINVHTVHDVIPLDRPDLSAIDGQALRRRLDAVARASDRLVTVSEQARERIIQQLGVGADRVRNLGGAVVDLDPDGAALPDGLVSGRYLLFCGLVERRKNLDRLVEAWAAAGRPLPLVVAGPDGEEGPALRARLAGAGATVLPYQPRQVLDRLLADARALVFPSLAEGFGLPVAEAMTLGTPSITSAGGALAETAGDAALLVDPLDTAALADAIRRVATDDALAARLAAAGRERSARFAPERFGARLSSFYRDLIAERSRLA